MQRPKSLKHFLRFYLLISISLYIITFFSFFWFLVNDSNWQKVMFVSIITFPSIIILLLIFTYKQPSELKKILFKRKSDKLGIRKSKNYFFFIIVNLAFVLITFLAFLHLKNLFLSFSTGPKVYEGSCLMNNSFSGIRIFPGKGTPRNELYLQNGDRVEITYKDYNNLHSGKIINQEGKKFAACRGHIKVVYLEDIELFDKGYRLSVDLVSYY